MKRLGVVLAACLLLGQAQAANDVAAKKRELDAVKSQLHDLQQQYRETTREQGDAAGALAASERAISDSTRVLRELGGQLSDSRNQLDRLGRQQAELQTRIERQRTHLADSLRALYRRGDGDALKLLLSGEDPNQAARDLRNLSRLSQAQNDAVAALRQNLAQLSALHEQAAHETAKLDALKVRRQTEQTALEADKRQRAQALAALSQTAGEQRRAIANLQRDEKALTALIDRLNRILAARAAAKRSTAKEKPAPRKSAPVGFNNDTPVERDTSSAFAQLRGKLRLPVVGELMNRFGAPREGGGVDWKGLFIRAANGQPVKAIAPGEVVFAEWMRGFGNLIVIDHGDGYMSLYSNNESLYKRVGDRVRMGETIAAVGNSGGQSDAGLYFEMRYQSRPLNPMNWVK